jgi:hypothetical protein
MDEEIKLKMIIQCIRNYKNKDFTDDEIKDKYSLAIDYMMKNFDSLFENSISNSGGIKSITEGNRSITYSDTNTNTIIQGDGVLISLLGRPYMRCY